MTEAEQGGSQNLAKSSQEDNEIAAVHRATSQHAVKKLYAEFYQVQLVKKLVAENAVGFRALRPRRSTRSDK